MHLIILQKVLPSGSNLQLRSETMENKPLILIIEDDKPIQNFISVSIKAQGYKCLSADNGKTALSLISSYNPDIIIIDLGLPDIDGCEVIKKTKVISKAIIIVVSARERERDKIETLDLGADDYLTKPFSVSELMARIRVALRHINQRNSYHHNKSTFFQVGNLKIDFEKRYVKVDHKEIHLTPIEYKIITLLANNAGKVVTHQFILSEIWGVYSGSETQSLRVFMANIRRKIEKDTTQPRYIFTEVGIGYRLVDE